MPRVSSLQTDADGNLPQLQSQKIVTSVNYGGPGAPWTIVLSTYPNGEEPWQVLAESALVAHTHPGTMHSTHSPSHTPSALIPRTHTHQSSSFAHALTLTLKTFKKNHNNKQ